MSTESNTSPAAPPRKGVRLTPEEAWQMLGDAHTGIFTSLRRDGVPISLPVWFAVIDGAIVMSTPGSSKKVTRLRHDARSSFLVESGERWAELKAVHLTGRAEVVAEPSDEIRAQVQAELDRKYARFRTQTEAMPSATRKHYGSAYFVRFVPDERIVRWNNALLSLNTAPATGS